ncbi:LacI family transcriptional regulator [Lichenihabitans sp. PAMC28606]|uniref:LacI family DNA-binding transcriptional regulator n=1 Tax=Lichenihabitans sp. PAMC28606 TaxID=2880932 RepID=UPI001D0A67E5|nr:LacI family DNA-binding transcriptional regulator [Lichenihabitans sp. PAMC28606]UDL93603.1 LacI family transcriptional regulator [Lichenihabitans sp. PAMC28606]
MPHNSEREPRIVDRAASPRAVSIRTVAERAGVSIATVSNVLNSRTRVGEELSLRVRAAVEELGYVADGTASRLRSRKQALAGVVVPDLKNSFFASFVSTLEQVARLDGFDLLVVSSANDPQQEAARLRAIRSWRPAGLIVIPCDGAFTERLPSWGLPIVLVDRLPDDAHFDMVAVDNKAASASMIRHLAEMGASSCVVVANCLRIGNIRERLDGIREAAGSTMDVTVLETGLDPSTIRRRIDTLMATSPLPDAIFALDNITTRVVFELLGPRLRAQPRGIALASFDDEEWMALVTPSITAVRQPVEAMAVAAWTQLVGRLKGDDGPHRMMELPCRIVMRGSTSRHEGERRDSTS